MPAGGERAEGFRHLGRLAVMALQSYVEFGDPDFPVFHRYDDDAVKWGGPNVDNQYLRPRIDGRGTYRISGDVSGVRDLILSTNEGDMQLEQYRVFEERHLSELDVAADGSVELTIGGPVGPPNHVPLDPDATLVLIRVYVADWERDGVPWFDIERVDRADAGAAAARRREGRRAARTRPRPGWSTASGTGRATSSSRRCAPWSTGSRRRAGRPAAPTATAYGAGWWELGPDERLRSSCPTHAPTTGSFQLYSTPWFESLDVRNRTVAASSATTGADEDGVIRIAVGACDPGIGARGSTRRAGPPGWSATASSVPHVRSRPTCGSRPTRIRGPIASTSTRRRTARSASSPRIERRFHR